MERIASFCVDHTKLDRGMYLSRQDGDVLTWDIRMKRPCLLYTPDAAGVEDTVRIEGYGVIRHE